MGEFDNDGPDWGILILLFGGILALVFGFHIKRVKPAPDFTAPELATGKVFKLSEHKGQVVVMDFWAPWCKPCMEEMPGFVKLHEAMKAETAYKFVSVSSDNDLDEVKEFVQKSTPPYTVLHADQHKGYDHDSIPTLYVIDCKGRLNVRLTGGIDPMDLIPRLKSAIAKCNDTGFTDGLYLSPPFFLTHPDGASEKETKS